MIPYLHIGPLTIGTFGLLMWIAFLVSYFVLRADMRQRRMAGDAATIVAVVALSGIAGAKLYHVLECPAEFVAHPFGQIFDRAGFAWAGGLIAGILGLLLVARHYEISPLAMLDASSPAAALGYAVGRIGCLISGDGDYGIPTSLLWGMSFPNGLVPTTERVHPTPIYEFIAGALIFWYLWKQGRKALLGPRPTGQITGEYLVLSGVARFLVEFIRINPRSFFGVLTNAQVISLLSMLAGAALLVWSKKKFHRMKGEHRILEHFIEKGDVIQPEYHRATPECPNPERWRMYDSMTAEVEVLEFLKALVTTIKPNLILETGTFMGISTLWLAQGLKENGSGKLITFENDPKVFAKAKERIDNSGLREWIEYRNQSSLEAPVDGTIDLLFSDSDPQLREKEIRQFLRKMNPNGLIVVHDSSSHLKTIREAAKRLEAEGLVSAVFMSTPRGLVLAQRRQGRA